MRFDRMQDLRSSDGYAVPAYLLEPDRPAGAIALAHGYGGAKEQMLGLAARLAEAGFATCCPDLRGHGEHPAPLGPGLLHDLDAAVGYCRRYGRVAALGHSLGGRLALMSSADLLIAVSPAIPKGRGRGKNTDKRNRNARPALRRVHPLGGRAGSPGKTPPERDWIHGLGKIP
jgi:dienelactone hydrolase